MRTLRIAAGGGLWGVAIISAFTLPLLIHVSTVHRTHWFGPVPDQWRRFLLEDGAAIWALLSILAVAGCAAGWRLIDPRKAAARGVILGAWPALIAFVAAIPGWLWMARLGVATGGQIVDALLMVGPTPLVAGAVTGGCRRWLPMAPAAALGALAGGALLWWLRP